MKYAWIASRKSDWPIMLACDVLGVSASGYFEHWRRKNVNQPSKPGMHKRISDEALNPFGLQREIVTIVGGFSTALALARASDLIASVPERHTGNLRAGMHSFPLPFSMPEVTVSLLWHPRLHADLAHRWLRGCVLDACAAPGSGG